MEPDMSEAELHATLKTMENNKSTGEDGYPAEFYKVFWIDIKDMLLNSYRYVEEICLLSAAQRRSIISLIPKTREKNPLFLKNWRPL